MIETKVRQQNYEYKARVEKLGGHVHMQFFSRRVGWATWAGIGTLVIAEDEMASWAECFAQHGLVIETKEPK